MFQVTRVYKRDSDMLVIALKFPEDRYVLSYAVLDGKLTMTYRLGSILDMDFCNRLVTESIKTFDYEYMQIIVIDKKSHTTELHFMQDSESGTEVHYKKYPIPDKLSYFYLGDELYPLHKKILVPYTDTTALLEVAERIHKSRK